MATALEIANMQDFLKTARPEDQWKKDSSLVQTKEHFEEMIHELLNAPVWAKTGQRVIANDTETTGLSFVNPDHHIVGISFSTPTRDWYIPVRHNTPEPQLNPEKVFKVLDEVIYKNDDLLLAGHNWKFDYNMFLKEGITGLTKKFKNKGMFDTQIMYWLLDENQKDDEGFYQIIPGQKAKFISYKSPFKQSPSLAQLTIPVLSHFEIKAIQQMGGFSLKALSNKILGVPMLEFFDEVVKKYKIPYVDIAMHIGGEYAKLDTKGTMALFNYGADKLYAEKLDGAFWNVEMPFVQVLANVERRGIPVAKEKLTRLRDLCVDGMESSMKELYEMVGYEFNINSGKQLAKVFTDLGIIDLVPTTDKGNVKTDEETIDMLMAKTNNPGLEKIVKFKKFKKMVGTYIDGDSGLYTCIDTDNRVHPSYLQTGTVTGRLSCINPPAQTWPANPILKFPLDYATVKQMEADGVDLEAQFEWGVKFDEKKNPDGTKTPIAYMGAHLRDCITEIETRPGYKLLVSDYSQMELRVLCHFAKDEKFLGAFISGYDFHSYNAMNMHNTLNPDDIWTIDMVTPEARRDAKAVSFGLAYGKTVNGFAEDFFGHHPDFYDGFNSYNGAPKIRKKYLDQAQSIIDAFFQAYTETADWIVKTHKYVETYGFIRCITGRKRRLPEIWNEQRGIQNRARRQGVNTKIQGSSADYMKMAMILLEEKLDGTGIEMLAPVHDELIFAVPPGLDDLAHEIVQHCMENVIPLFCPMIAEPHMAVRYGSAK